MSLPRVRIGLGCSSSYFESGASSSARCTLITMQEKAHYLIPCFPRWRGKLREIVSRNERHPLRKELLLRALPSISTKDNRSFSSMQGRAFSPARPIPCIRFSAASCTTFDSASLDRFHRHVVVFMGRSFLFFGDVFRSRPGTVSPYRSPPVRTPPPSQNRPDSAFRPTFSRRGVVWVSNPKFPFFGNACPARQGLGGEAGSRFPFGDLDRTTQDLE